MIKTLKKVFISSLSVLAISVICWTIAFLNPSLMYANQTTFDIVTVYHNYELEPETENIITDAIAIIKKSELFTGDVKIDLCLNEDSFYPEVYPLKGGLAYAFWDKAIIYNSEPHFSRNTAEFTWEVNDNEFRKADLTWLLAHEFTHNLQYNMDNNFIFKYEFWQQEGYAEYISRQFQNDGKLKEKIQFLIEEEKMEHTGIPVFLLDDGTIQNLSYYKYGLMVQYLMEQEGIDFKMMEKEERTFDQVYNEMVEWGKS